MLDLSDAWDLGDVEWVWATVAACYSKKQVYAWVTRTIASHRIDLGCFWFEAVSDCNGRGEYPRGIMKILMRVLRPMGVAAKDADQDTFYIQTPVWYHLSATALLREIRERGYDGSASKLRAWLAKIKPAKRDDGPVVWFETEPGKQMQADVIVFRRAKSPMSAFVATLGYSRMTYVRFVPDESFESVHESALSCRPSSATKTQDIAMDARAASSFLG